MKLRAAMQVAIGFATKSDLSKFVAVMLVVAAEAGEGKLLQAAFVQDRHYIYLHNIYIYVCMW